MSEYVEFAVGLEQVKQNLDKAPVTSSPNQQHVALAAFRELILSRPDIGT